jgi:hypothetical protein
MKTPQHFDGQCDCFRRKEPAAKDGFAQPRNFTVFVNFDQSVRYQAGNLQPD